jgi:SAM-dependent methyltransferase
MNKAHLTAIARTKPSAPAQWLHENGKLLGNVLDYGCGRGKDADTYGCDKYDPHYFPELMVLGEEILYDSYQTVMCNFVLNVIEDEIMRWHTLNSIRNLLKPGGHAYVSIRADKAKLKGRTSKGTWQGYIQMPEPWTLIHKGSGYELYELVKDA